jgi:hypothetical protein
VRRTASEKLEIIRLVEGTDLPVRATLRQPGSGGAAAHRSRARTRACRRRRGDLPRHHARPPIVWVGREARLAWWASHLAPRFYEWLMLRRALE